MTKKPALWIVLGVVVVLIVAGVVWGKQYYENHYVGSDYYAMVPVDYDITPVTMYYDQGEDVGMGKEYKLTAYNEQGESREVEFDVHDYYSDGSVNYPQPGAYLWVSASKDIVVNWSTIGENDIPATVLAKIKAQ